MLVLTRKEKESIVIAGNIEIKITCIKGNKVRIGIVAPRDMPVFRKEILSSSSYGNEYKAAASRGMLCTL
jgi:carbon storage regulator